MLVYSVWRMCALPVNILAEGVTLEDYLQQVITNHLFFTKQALSSAIELQQQQRSLGDEDRALKVGSRVIQSRDNEQNARLAYATNAAKYHELWLRYMALIDMLLPAGNQQQESSS